MLHITCQAGTGYTIKNKDKEGKSISNDTRKAIYETIVVLGFLDYLVPLCPG